MKRLVKSNIALAEILLLVVAIVAFAWMVHTEVGIVSADGQIDSGAECASDDVCKSHCDGDLNQRGEQYKRYYGGDCVIPEGKEIGTCHYQTENCDSNNPDGYCNVGICIGNTQPNTQEEETPTSESGGFSGTPCGSSGICTPGNLCPPNRIMPGQCLSTTDVCCGEISLDDPEGDSGTGVTFGGVLGGIYQGYQGINLAKGIKNDGEKLINRLRYGPDKKVPGTAGGANAGATTGSGVAKEANFVINGVKTPASKISELGAEKLTEDVLVQLGKDGGLKFLGGEQVAALSENSELITSLFNENGLAVYKGKVVEWGELTGGQRFFAGPGGTIVSGVLWAAAVAALAITLAKQFASQRNAGDITAAAIGGAVAGIATVTVWALLTEKALLVAGTAGPPGWVAGLIVAVVVAAYMVAAFQDYSKQIFTFYPSMWQPPVGSNNCEKCNDLEIEGINVCSEYTCHSYGANCEWINDKTEYEKCTEVGQGDKSVPVISPLMEAYEEPVFEDEKFKYVATTAGVKISYENSETNGCVPAFSEVNIALGTDENAHCKISIEPHKESRDAAEVFGNMKNLAEGTVFTKTHTLTIPSSVTASETSQEAGGYKTTNGGIYQFYIRCMDVKGNINNFDYSVGFCVHTGPDLTPPIIKATNPETDSFISYGVVSIDNFEVYTNEPAICKWDFENKKFNFMSNSFVSCSQNINDKIRGYDYGCRGNLSRFVPEQDNTYYIACMDQPELIGTAKEDQRNTAETISIVLKGSKELIIQDIKISGKENGSTIKQGTENSNVNLEVSTFGGSEEGKARCKHSNTGTNENDYAYFFNNGNPEYLTTNTQELFLAQGIYRYFIKCEDAAGNTATSTVEFEVESDNEAPNIVRVYKEADDLMLITDEEAECYYTTFDCTYDYEQDGTPMISSNGVEHTIEWVTDNDLYIKCIDEYGNRPDLDQCSLRARPFEVPDVIDVPI
jgi:hypothetical protein